MESQPKVGIGVLLIKGDKVLLGKRKNISRNGDWNAPGGHLEFGETPEAAAIREVTEETGIYLSNVKFLTLTNDIFIESHKHYVTIWMYAFLSNETPINNEPDKCEGWEWFTWGQFPQNLFLSEQNLIESSIELPKK